MSGIELSSRRRSSPAWMGCAVVGNSSSSFAVMTIVLIEQPSQITLSYC